ncbi:hypothetical protein NDU88_008823 [Pleurodeles waltl]|uniref:Uncharacterized protein n=1 Tax=Pleurodeles waltl TaxID=8319 RepID=A0AAV7QRU1_PLEWA|nr:hypothetical protein NDU88_008823 [Pleurodeles waltl]
MNVGSVYVPPCLHSSIFPELSATLLGIPYGTLILGGDKNAIMDPKLDTLSGALAGGDTRALSTFVDVTVADLYLLPGPQGVLRTIKEAIRFCFPRRSMQRKEGLWTRFTGKEMGREGDPP